MAEVRYTEHRKRKEALIEGVLEGAKFRRVKRQGWSRARAPRLWRTAVSVE